MTDTPTTTPEQRRRALCAKWNARAATWPSLPTHSYRYVQNGTGATIATVTAKSILEADAKLLTLTGIDAVLKPSIGCIRADWEAGADRDGGEG